MNKIATYILIGTVLCPAAFGRRVPAQKIDDIQKVVANTMGANRVPAISVAVGMDGKVIWKGAFGSSDIEKHIPASNRTEYRIGSVTKLVTAVAIMQLAERNLVDLDAPVQKYVPSFPQKPYPITLREILGHLSGIRHYKDTVESRPSHRSVQRRSALVSAWDPRCVLKSCVHVAGRCHRKCL